MSRISSLIHVTNSTFINDVDMAYDNLRIYNQGAALRIIQDKVDRRNEESAKRFKRWGWIGYVQKTYTVEDIVYEWYIERGSDDDSYLSAYAWVEYTMLLEGENRWMQDVRNVRDSVHDQVRNQGTIDLHIEAELYNYIIRNASV
jgi:hypothetical protein